MRVHSTYEVNNHKQHHPFTPQDADSASVGQLSPVRSFAEHLRSHIQQPITPVVTAVPENAISGIFWGYYPALKVQSKPETTREDSAS